MSKCGECVSSVGVCSLFSQQGEKDDAAQPHWLVEALRCAQGRVRRATKAMLFFFKLFGAKTLGPEKVPFLRDLSAPRVLPCLRAYLCSVQGSLSSDRTPSHRDGTPRNKISP